jgi:4-amino-4-deoxy-L-arabinose transferase-like glycosyltransferase
MLKNEFYSSDEPGYDQIAVNFLNGRGFVTDDGLYARRGPVYPLFLATIYLILGHSFVGVRFIQAIIGALTSLIIYPIGKEMFNRKVGLISAFISVFYYPFIQQSAYLLTEVPFTFLLALSILFFLRYYNLRKNCSIFIASILLGIASLCRGVVLFFSLFLFLWCLRLAEFRTKETIKMLIFIFSGITIIIAPWAIRNFRIYRAFIPSAIESGKLLYVGNNPKATGGTGGWSRNGIDQFYPEDVDNLHSLEADRIMFRRALNFIMAHPKKTIFLMGKKFINMWRPFFYDARLINKIIMSLLYIPILILSIGGMVESAFHNWQKRLLLYLLIFYYISIHLLTIAEIRYRYPIEPYLIIFAGYFISRIKIKYRFFN